MLIANVSDWSTRVQYLPYCTTVHFDSKTKQNNKSTIYMSHKIGIFKLKNKLRIIYVIHNYLFIYIQLINYQLKIETYSSIFLPLINDELTGYVVLDMDIGHGNVMYILQSTLAKNLLSHVNLEQFAQYFTRISYFAVISFAQQLLSYALGR